MPLAGVGGFNVAATEITADNMLLYPGTGDTGTMDQYPQAIVELQGVTLDNLWLYKTFDLGATPGLSGQGRVLFVSNGASDAESVLVKSTAIATDGDATFEDFAISEHASRDPRGQFDIAADGPVTLERPRINAHYLATGSITLSNTDLLMCYDYDDDDDYEVGGCPSGDPISQSYELASPGRAADPEVSESDDQWAVGGPVRDVGETIGDVADTIGMAVTETVSSIGDTIDSLF